MRGKNIFLAFLLTVVLPGILIGIFGPEPKPPSTETVALSFETKPAPATAEIPVLTDDGIVSMELDDYITCVVLREMPSDFEVEALKAQAVVARTYALRANEKRTKHQDAAVCTQPSCCQGFWEPEAFLASGGTQEAFSKVQNAVLATKDIVITYEGQLIDATYFSCSGGMTEDALAVWGADVPYLRSRESPGEESANHYVDTITMPISDFCTQLGLENTKKLRIGSISHTTGGGVDTIQIGQKQYSGTKVRSLLGLRSTAFAITVLGDSVSITTRGYGHRVGMSQYGAEAMAAGGSTFDEILLYYYSGVEITSH